MMSWNPAKQARFKQLRTAELTEGLGAEDRAELAVMLADLEADEARMLAPGLVRVRAEQMGQQQRLNAVQADNEALAGLLLQQEQLAVDARKWLVELENRQQRIHDEYTALTGEALAT
jgi:hypothetical protein